MSEIRDPSDADLWARVIRGDARAFELVFDRHARAIFAFCVRRTRDRLAAEDLMSSTFLHAWRRRGDMQLTEEGPVPWIYGIAANLVRRHLRGAGRAYAAMSRLPIPESEPDPSDAIADRLDGARLIDRIGQILLSLPERDQELFVLCVWQGLSYQQAASALDVPVGTIRSRLSRARDKVRLALGEPARGDGDESSEGTNPSATARKKEARSDG